MNEAIRALQPTELWNHFADINAIPRASKKEEKNNRVYQVIWRKFTFGYTCR